MNETNVDCDNMTYAEQLKDVISKILWSIKQHIVDPDIHWQCEALCDVDESGDSEESESNSFLLKKSKTLSLDSIVSRKAQDRDDLDSEDSFDKAEFGSILDSDDDSDLSDNEKERRKNEREVKEGKKGVEVG